MYSANEYNYMSKMYRMERKNYTEASYKKESSLNRMKPDIIHISGKSNEGRNIPEIPRKRKKYLCPPITNSP